MKKSINLLPPGEQKLNRQITVTHQLKGFGIWLVLSLVVVSGILFAAQVILQTQLNTAQQLIETKNQELNSLEQAFLQDEVVSLNQDLGNFEKLREQSTVWSGVLTEFARLLPGDLTLDELVIDQKDLKVEAKGRADARGSVLIFRQSLIASDYFTNVNFPLANLEKPINLNWQYRFFLNPEKLKAVNNAGETRTDN